MSLAERIAALEGGVGGVCTSSGHAAQIMALFPLMQPGDNIVASTRLYGGTVTQFTHTIRRFGWSARFVDTDDLAAVEAAADDRTRALFCESIANPGTANKCYDPRHAVRVVRGGRTAEFVICFQCSQYVEYRDGVSPSGGKTLGIGPAAKPLLDTILADVETTADYVLAHAYGGYTTNLPLADLLDGQAWVAYKYDGDDLEPAHGGPARLLVPHLYLWKSAKWVHGFEFISKDRPGFWEMYGYHMRGDPWQEERYS